MFFKSTTVSYRNASIMTGIMSRLLTLAAAAVLLGSATVSLAAVFPGYSFLTINSSSSGTGNTTNTQFLGANGVINVTHFFPTASGVGSADNNNPLIAPSDFSALFPGTGSVQGHLAQTVYAHTSVVTFSLSGYTITPDTAFGIWNTSDEVTKPVGGNPVYRIQLLDASSTLVNPSTFSYMDNVENTGSAGVLSHHKMVMTPSTGEITFGASTNSFGTHTDATFWKNIPPTTKEIRVYADLPPLNTIGDGVGYYFAELKVPEPCGLALCVLGLLPLSALDRRRRR